MIGPTKLLGKWDWKMAKKPGKTKKATMSVKPDAVVVCLIDETGSMALRHTETITAYNSYLAGLREDLEQQIHLLALKFDRFGDEPTVRPLGEAAWVHHAPELTKENYRPRGNTPLYDAIGVGVREAETMAARVGTTRVTLMIQTDGMENASQEFTYAQVRTLLDLKKSAGWNILFLAADLGAAGYRMAATLGVSSAHTMSYVSGNSVEAFAGAAASTRSYGVTGQSTGFSDEDKDKAGDTSA